jgi:DNA-directed RNA polymerase subunit RPC12/RpoP
MSNFLGYHKDCGGKVSKLPLDKTRCSRCGLRVLEHELIETQQVFARQKFSGIKAKRSRKVYK